MSTKAFVLLLFGVLVFGGGLGGSFVAGLVTGKNQKVEAAPVVISAPAISSAETERNTAPGISDLDLTNLRQRFQAGELSQDEVATLREQFRSQFTGASAAGQFTGPTGFRDRTPLVAGTVTVVENNTLILNTEQGSLRVSLGEDVTIRQTVEVAIENLSEGTRIAVVGQPGDDGTIAANMIQVIPDGSDFNAVGGFGGMGILRDVRGRSGGQESRR